jgi:aryl-alcohol dehydrogenase-like predicted oxidoreductase
MGVECNMEYRRLGHTGAKVSALCLGAMTFGEADDKSMMHEVGCDESTAFAIMDRAIEAGINFIDTANVYGQDGLSERVVGKWLKERKARDSIVLATKFRFSMQQRPNGSGGSRLHIMRAAEDSLRRLQTDRLDLYQIHMQDLDTPEEETLRALDDLMSQGKIVYIGASNYAAYRLVDSLWTSRDQKRAKFVTLQALYNLVSRELELELAPACVQHGLGILPWSPLAGGFLSGKFRKHQPPPKGSRLAKWGSSYERHATDKNFAIIDALVEVAESSQHSPAQVALAWLLQKPNVTAPIIGARSLTQLDDNLRALDVKLSEKDMKKLDDVSALDLRYPHDFISRLIGRW